MNVEIIKQLSYDEYHASKAFGSSQIKDFITKSPKYFQAKHILKSLPDSQSDAMKIGSATHSAWMEPNDFESEYAIEPDCDGRTKAGKAIKAEFAAASEGKKILNAKQGLLTTRMTGALDSDQNASALLKKSTVENSIFWTDDETGLNLRVRPDIWRKGHYLADLKTTKDASPEGFARAIFDRGYHISAAMYLDAMEQMGEGITDFIFICVESHAPYLTAIYTLSDQAIEIGRREYKQALIDLKQCIDTDNWAGYNADQVAEISLPKWVLNREIDR